MKTQRRSQKTPHKRQTLDLPLDLFQRIETAAKKENWNVHGYLINTLEELFK
jgi:hypothetical protein